MISLLLLGFLIGMKHAMEADHIAAVATLVSKTNSRKQAIKLGSIWGLGHTITLFIVGSFVLMTDYFIPENVASWLEFAVGVMLVLLGVDVIRRLIKNKIHFHSHKHKGNQTHFHAHSHNKSSKRISTHDHLHQEFNQLTFKALFIGVLHGLAGSAVLILLTLETIKSPFQGLIYILLFGAGSIFGMAILSYIISVPLRASALRLTWMNNSLQLLIGVSTIFLGALVLFNSSNL